MVHENELTKELKKFKNGMNLILESISNYENKEEQEIIENVFNGNVNEGYAQNRYMLTFSRSFDEEVINFGIFLEEFINEPILYNAIPNSAENIQNALKGFEICKNSLDEIVSITKSDAELKNHLFNFQSDSSYNPFKEYGLVEFRNRFKGWARAFQKELKDELGRRKFEKFKSKSSVKSKNEYLLEKLKEVTEYNEKQMKLAGYDQNNAKDLIEVSFHEFSCYNLFFDTSLRFEVDPFKEYGEEKILEMIQKYETLMKK